MRRLLPLALLAGCSTTGRLYPVSGPRSEQRPAPVLSAKLFSLSGSNGKLELTLPDGTVCKGEWSTASGSGVGFAAGTLLGPHGSVHVTETIDLGRGQSPGSAIAHCPDGTRFEVEFLAGSGGANGFGAAKDTAGNVYKLLF